jgi:hypothetical protein
MKTLMHSFIALYCLCSLTGASYLICIVKTGSGEPIEGVIVSSPPYLYAETKTDSNGSIKLANVDRFKGKLIVHFWHPRFRPLTKIIDESTSTLEVTLEDASGSDWVIPSCSNSKPNEKRTGDKLKVVVPKGAVVSKGGDVDYSSYSIAYNLNSFRARMEGIYGPHATSGYPSRNLLLNSEMFTERRWKFEDFEGVDMRGRSQDGTYWRYLGIIGECIEYRGVSKEAADFFDRIIDGVCFDKR